MAADADVVVVGAGIVGLACAAALARAGRTVCILERGSDIALETTSRNSEVIHSGIYYPTGSLKAELCVAGALALYERCARLSLPHRRIGKLVVAADDGEAEALAGLDALGRANGVAGLELLDPREIARREPAVRGALALWSPDSGIVDAHAFALSFLAEAEAHGAVLLRRHEVVELERRDSGWRVRARTPDGDLESADCRAVVNAAGLRADRVAALAGVDVEARGLRIHFCKGDYFALAPGAGIALSHLVYPVPAGPGLGIHATVDLAGRIRFGPDSEYVDAPVLDVDPAKTGAFERAVRRYLPGLPVGALSPDYAGIRPKLAGPGEAFRDFAVEEESQAGCPGLVDCIGIESPGLTAAPAIAERVADRLASL